MSGVRSHRLRGAACEEPCEEPLRGARLFCEDVARTSKQAFLVALSWRQTAWGTGEWAQAGQLCDAEHIQGILMARKPRTLDFSVRARHVLARTRSQANSTLPTERDCLRPAQAR